ncbi:uncharacterized protein [Leptinotarsa decemlineata]|uniref:uncharacterized protein n=1 Tax=Leptinotarsa decemlineata TaxID=7539 RepID=UPI003D309E07
MTRAIVLFFKIANILCIIPQNVFEIKPTEEKMWKNICQYIVMVTLSAIMFINTYILCRVKILSYIARLLLVFSSAFEVLPSVFMVYSSLRNKTNWKYILTRNSYLNIKSPRYRNDFIKKKHCSKYMIIQPIYLCFMVIHIYRHFSKLGFHPTIIMLIIPKIYIIHSLMLATMVTASMKHQLKCLGQKLKDLMCPPRYVKHTPTKQKILDEIHLVRCSYEIILKMTDSYNAIFGNFIFVAICSMIFRMLTTVNFFCFLREFYVRSGLSSRAIACLIILAVGIFCIIISCDETIREANKITRICYNIQENDFFENESEIEREISDLIEFVKTCPVVFEAAKSIEIEKSTILHILGILTTYWIVILQFNGIKFQN